MADSLSSTHHMASHASSGLLLAPLVRSHSCFFPFPGHSTPGGSRERGHAMPSHELLFPTDDLRSQHNSSRVHTAPGLLVAFFSHATRLASANQVIFCRIIFKKYISISSTFKLILVRMICRLSFYTFHSIDSYAFLPYEDS